MQFLANYWQPAASSPLDTQRLKAKKQVTFQTRWLTFTDSLAVANVTGSTPAAV